MTRFMRSISAVRERDEGDGTVWDLDIGVLESMQHRGSENKIEEKRI